MATESFVRAETYRVQKPFKFAGRNYVVNDRFDWRRCGCSLRRVRQMFEGRFLTLTEAKKPEPPAEVTQKHLGGGWYIITDVTGEEHRVQGREAADKLFTELDTKHEASKEDAQQTE